MLVLLRDQAPKMSNLLHTVVSLRNTIPALVKLVTILLGSEQGLQPSQDTSRLPLHTAGARYLATAAIHIRFIGKTDQLEAARLAVDIVAEAQPQALVLPDPVTGLQPAWQVALSWHATSVELISPSCVRYCRN